MSATGHSSGHSPSGVDRGAIFSDILLRNALRREARLPILDVGRTYRREVEQASWRAHVKKRREAMRAEVLSEHRRSHGPGFPRTAAERWLLTIMTNRALRRSFDAQRSR